MSRNKRLTPFCFLLLVGFLFSVSLLSLNPKVQAQTTSEENYSSFQVPNINYENRTVYVGLSLINIYSFDYKTGSYTFDFYVAYYWSDPNISTIDWYLMNGYPTFPGAKLLVSSNYNGSVKSELYRVRASLNTPLAPKNYPFESISLPISIELLPQNYNVTLVWVNNNVGIAKGFVNLGWNTPSFTLSTSNSTYSVGVTSPRVDMFIIQTRSVYFAFVGTILPPLIFCIVSAVSFLFKMHEINAFSLRVGINTSMLITAVLFNINQQNNIPPISQLTLYDAFIDSVFVFLAINLIITVFGYVQYIRTKDQSKVDKLNKQGIIISLITPIVIFFALFLL